MATREHEDKIYALNCALFLSLLVLLIVLAPNLALLDHPNKRIVNHTVSFTYDNTLFFTLNVSCHVNVDACNATVDKVVALPEYYTLVVLFSEQIRYTFGLFMCYLFGDQQCIRG
jgi:hypothetical protein